MAPDEGKRGGVDEGSVLGELHGIGSSLLEEDSSLKGEVSLAEDGAEERGGGLAVALALHWQLVVGIWLMKGRTSSLT
jgi:hypothetical protein